MLEFMNQLLRNNNNLYKPLIIKLLMPHGIIIPPEITCPRAARYIARQIETSDRLTSLNDSDNSYHPVHMFSGGNPETHEYILQQVKTADLVKAYAKALRIQRNHFTKDRRND